MIVTFIGHGKIFYDEDQKQQIRKIIEDCIEKGADNFYCGGYGNFDYECAGIIKELKETYPIKSFLVTAYQGPILNKKLQYIERCHYYDGFIYPELEEVPLKFAISKRNERMIDQADIVVAFIDHTYGGAYTSYQYAVRKKKTIINVADYKG